jgi:hypothetical protein
MVKVKSEADIKANYEASAALVPDRFEKGVRGASWQDSALDGQALYEEQMRKDEILRRRASGIAKVSDETWRRSSIDKGKGVIGSRMRAASEKQIAGFRPYKAALESVTLPARTADPETNVMNRVIPIVRAMVDTKKAESA